MSIVTLWNNIDKSSGQTLSAIAIATFMALEHNYRILLVDATFADRTIERAFWKHKENKMVSKLNAGKLDISSGAEGLISAVSSNKATPEIITNYTRIVFKNRLDILLGLKTQDPIEHEKSLMLYKDLINTANKFYDMVIVDLSKSLDRPSTESILNISDLILYTMPPNMHNLDTYLEKREGGHYIISDKKVIPFFSRIDETSTYNIKNMSRYLKEKDDVGTVLYNVRYAESTNEAKTANFITNVKLSKAVLSANGEFFQELERACNIIIEKLKEFNR